MKLIPVVFSIITLLVATNNTVAQGDTAFSYQGRLLDAGTLADGRFNVEISLWDDALAGNQVKDKTLVGGCHDNNDGDAVNLVRLWQVVIKLEGPLIVKEFLWGQANFSGTGAHEIETLDASLDGLVHHVPDLFGR